MVPILDRSLWPQAAVTHVQALEAEVARLEARNRDLELALRADYTPPPAFRLTPQEQAVFALLMRRDFVPHEALVALLAGRSPKIDIGKNVPQVVIYKMRDKLRPHGIAITNDYGRGYWMAPETKVKVRAMADGASDA